MAFSFDKSGKWFEDRKNVGQIIRIDKKNITIKMNAGSVVTYVFTPEVFRNIKIL